MAVLGSQVRMVVMSPFTDVVSSVGDVKAVRKLDLHLSNVSWEGVFRHVSDMYLRPFILSLAPVFKFHCVPPDTV